MDSLKSSSRGLSLRVHFRNSRLRALAAHALEGRKPDQARDWMQHPVILELGGRYAAWLISPPYWSSHVGRALLATALLSALAMAACVGWLPLEEMLGAQSGLWIAATLAVLSIVSITHAMKSHGPAEPITPQSYSEAWSRLRISTDDRVASLGLIKSLLLVFVLLVDGAVLGIAMSRSLGAFLTPRLATYVSIGWGVASTTLLWHLAVLAAEELRANLARATIRRLDASSRPEDRKLAADFLSVAGSRIDHDLSTRAPIKKRVILFTVALLLATTSVGLRIAGGSAPTSAPDPVPSLESGMFKLAMTASPEIDLPPAPPAQDDGGPSNSPSSENVALTLWIGASVLAAIVVISSMVLYWTLAKCEFIDKINSPRDRAVVERFDSKDSVAAYNHTHLRNVMAALESRLQHFAREVELAKRSLSPSEARSWPPVDVRAAEVLAAALRVTAVPNGLYLH